MPTTLLSDANAPQWAELRALTEALRHTNPLLPGSQGISHVFCAESYGLRQVCLDHPTLVLVLEGAKRYAREADGTLPQSPLTLAGAPTLLLLPADTPLYIENIPSADRYLALCLCFGPALLDSAARHSLPDSTPAENLTTNSPQANIVHTQTESLLTSLTLLLRNALTEGANPQAQARLLELQCEQILLLLLLHGMGPHWLARRDEMVTSALTLIRENPHLPWTVDSLAEHLHCSGRTLRRRLQHEGRSLRELLRHARLHTALGMLQQQRCTVSEAAFSCGYDSLSRFSQRFREHFGLLPSQLLRGTALEDRQAV